MSQQSHRGAASEDQKLFAPAQLPVLRTAAADFCWLLDRDYAPRSALELLFANSLTDTAPLHDKVQSIVTDDFVARIANEGRSGRVLAIQAVDLDSGESVVFDLTAIAQGKNFPVCARMSPRQPYSLHRSPPIPPARTPEAVQQLASTCELSLAKIT